MPVYPNFYQTLLPCPIVELRGYAAACGLQGKLYAYLDFGGPTGTSRDALAEGMLALAAEKGRLAPGQPVVEASSGAFGMALALAGLTAGHPVWLAMPGGCTAAAAGDPAAPGRTAAALPRPERAGRCQSPWRSALPPKRAGII